MALHSVDSSEEMREAWIAWSQQSAKYQERDGLREWKNSKQNGGVTLGTIIQMAQDDGWIQPPC